MKSPIIIATRRIGNVTLIIVHIAPVIISGRLKVVAFIFFHPFLRDIRKALKHAHNNEVPAIGHDE